MTHEKKYFFCPTCQEKIELKSWMTGWITCDDCGYWLIVSMQKVYLESELQTEKGE
jgi:DNA-directed RNA polymerase subunit RPC12/RpoP